MNQQELSIQKLTTNIQVIIIWTVNNQLSTVDHQQLNLWWSGISTVDHQYPNNLSSNHLYPDLKNPDCQQRTIKCWPSKLRLLMFTPSISWPSTSELLTKDCLQLTIDIGTINTQIINIHTLKIQSVNMGFSTIDHQYLNFEDSDCQQ